MFRTFILQILPAMQTKKNAGWLNQASFADIAGISPTRRPVGLDQLQLPRTPDRHADGDQYGNQAAGTHNRAADIEDTGVVSPNARFFLSAQIQLRNQLIQVDELPIAMEGVMPIEQDVQPGSWRQARNAGSLCRRSGGRLLVSWHQWATGATALSHHTRNFILLRYASAVDFRCV